MMINVEDRSTSTPPEHSLPGNTPRRTRFLEGSS